MRTPRTTLYFCNTRECMGTLPGFQFYWMDTEAEAIMHAVQGHQVVLSQTTGDPGFAKRVAAAKREHLAREIAYGNPA